jgi:hypothetical protein
VKMESALVPGLPQIVLPKRRQRRANPDASWGSKVGDKEKGKSNAKVRVVERGVGEYWHVEGLVRARRKTERKKRTEG